MSSFLFLRVVDFCGEESFVSQTFYLSQARVNVASLVRVFHPIGRKQSFVY